MTPREILQRYDAEMRSRVVGTAPGFRAEWDGPVLRMIGPDREPSSNGILFSRLDETNADSTIARQIAFFAQDGRAFEWKLFDHDEPADLARRLEAAGFEAEERETMVALDTAREIPRPDPAGVEIRRLDYPANFGVIAEVNTAVYGDPDHGQWLTRVIADEKRADPDSLSVYAAFDGETLVSVGWMRHQQGDSFGSLWGGSTLPEYRGRSIYAALVAARVDEARQRGCRWLTVDCSSMSLPILERRGFQRLAVITPFIWTPNGA